MLFRPNGLKTRPDTPASYNPTSLGGEGTPSLYLSILPGVYRVPYRATGVFLPPPVGL